MFVCCLCRQKAAFKMFFSDWVSDVCASYLLEPLFLEERADAVEAFLDIVSDEHIFVAVPVAHFVGGALHPRIDHLDRVGRALEQTLVQLLHRWRQDEGDRKSTRLNSSH